MALLKDNKSLRPAALFQWQRPSKFNVKPGSQLDLVSFLMMA
jgi:hypothetical protein